MDLAAKAIAALHEDNTKKIKPKNLKRTERDACMRYYYSFQHGEQMAFYSNNSTFFFFF